MNHFKKYNLIFGWLAFAVSAVVYIATMEPTASLWDCAEFIATSYKLEVGHPPGAPLFMMIARFFTIFGGPEQAGMLVNLMSSLASAFTILFLFWTITHLARKIYAPTPEGLTVTQTWTVIGAGLIGSIAYTFTDTFWFSAIEGEVYALSSMFTALVFWAILQWENVADKPNSARWLILIAYLMGLSIGIHVLNLLTIPALVFVYYFKKYPETTKWGVVKATIASVVILGAIYFVIMPYTVQIGAWFDKIFVNSFGLPVNSGMLFFCAALTALAVYGIYITHKKGKVLANVIILCTTVILLAYSSYASVVIRSSANPPMNSNDPSNPYGLYSLLNRDQYGEKPLFYGPDYSSPVLDAKYRASIYLDEDGKYKKHDMFVGYEYPSEFMHLFPRMYSHKREHELGYKLWGNVTGRPKYYYGERYIVPTAGENLRYFFSYQMNFMFWRYFLWNFAGRQSDIQSTGEITNGNWMSGIKFIDQLYLGPQDNIPSEMAQNKGRNRYYFLPFILGLVGLIYQLGRDKKNFTVVMWIFFMTGIALVLYFNTTPGEPRERDYVYAGAFYAFCIWIGFGVLALRDALVKLAKKDTVGIVAASVLVCSVVPIILAVENWDDHDRSRRYIARDVGYNYLTGCLPNSIILNYGDNDTFPLWYNQEVEGVRLDVRIMNMSYLLADWYVEQMRIRSNESDPVPFSLPRSKYVNTNDMLYVNEEMKTPISLRAAMNYIKNDDPRTKDDYFGNDVVPGAVIYVPVNKENVLAAGIVAPKDAHLIEDSIVIDLRGKRMIDRSELMLLDLLDNFDWKRPIYFTQHYYITSLGLRDYLQYDGFGYRLVPIRTPLAYNGYDIGRIDTEYLWDKLMNDYRYGNIKDPRVYADSFTQIVLNTPQSRNAFARLAKGLLAEGDTVRAVQALDRAIEEMPFSQLRHGVVQTIPLIEGYYMAGERERAREIFDEFREINEEYVNYFARFPESKLGMVADEFEERLSYLNRLYRVALRFEEYERADQIQAVAGRFGYVFD